MTLTYALVEDFFSMKDVKKPDSTGVFLPVTEEQYNRDRVKTYLLRATRFIQRYTRRDFYPWVETREYPIPYAFHDLSLRRFPSAHLILDQDLTEILSVNNGNENIDSAYYYPLELNIKPHYAIAIKFPKYWGGWFGGVTPFKRYDEGIVAVKAVWGYTENTGGWRYPDDFWVNTGKTLPSLINDSVTQIDITNATADYDQIGERAFLEGRLLKIDDEFLEITGIDNTKITVIRGARGTEAKEHNSGSLIRRWKVIEDIVEACLQIAKTWREADISAGSRIGVSDVSSGAELSIPSDPLRILASYHRSLILE